MNDDSFLCVFLTDFKTKFESTKHCNNPVENFEKRGLAWHGALVFYSVWVYVESDVYEIRQEKNYINHINTL